MTCRSLVSLHFHFGYLASPAPQTYPSRPGEHIPLYAATRGSTDLRVRYADGCAAAASPPIPRNIYGSSVGLVVTVGRA